MITMARDTAYLAWTLARERARAPAEFAEMSQPCRLERSKNFPKEFGSGGGWRRMSARSERRKKER